MTDTLLDPNDTGEIPRVDVGETTQRLNPSVVNAPSFDAIPRRQFDETAEIRLPQTIGVVDSANPPSWLYDTGALFLPPGQPRPPAPLPDPAGPPKPAADLAAAQPIAPWERVAGAQETAVVSLLGALGGEPLPPLRPSVPPRPTSTLWQRLTYRPKHRAPSVWRGFGQLTVAVVAVSALLWWVIA